jgi:hypothetical protein
LKAISTTFGKLCVDSVIVEAVYTAVNGPFEAGAGD